MSVKGKQYDKTYKYTPEMVAKFVDMLRSGAGRVETCLLCDIHYETFCKWMKNRPEFEFAVQKAEAECKVRCIKIVQKAAISTWQAACWWLERKHRNEFASQQNLAMGMEVKVKLSKPKDIDPKKM